MTQLRTGGSTDVGRRRKDNQDSHLIAAPLFVVADGMGGHAGGDVASQTAVAAMREAFGPGSTRADLVEAVRRANQAVIERAAGDPDLATMGTTVTAAALVASDEGEGEVVALAHVGDSRAYLFRDGHLDQLTDDHSVPQELYRAGQLTEAQAAVDPRRNQITRVLGLGEVEPDMLSVVPYVGDRILLCSDGLTNEVTDGRIAEILAQVDDAQEASDRLVRLAYDNGGADNITVVIVDVVDDDDRAGAASESLASASGLERGATGRLLSSDERNAQLRSLSRDDEPEFVGAGPIAAERQQAPAEHELPSRRVTGRVIAFILALLLVVGGAVAAVGWYARGSYFVGLDQGRVTIFQGRPGGLLFFSPTVKERTDVPEARLLPAQIPALEAGKEEPDLAEARRYVANLRDEIEARTATSTATSAPTTTTTVAASPLSAP